MFQQIHSNTLEELHIKIDPKSGLQAIIAIHNTHLGAALGGCRFISYQNPDDGVIDAIKLSKAMTYKAALAGLKQGGGKSVILYPTSKFDRSILFAEFGRFINSLNGKYITAMDSGTFPEDMDSIAEHTSFVSSTTGHDPSPHTATGVFAGIRACIQHQLNHSDLNNCHIAIQGLGHVGYQLASLLFNAGAKLTVADVNSEKTNRCATKFNATITSTQNIHKVQCDVFAPCALGGIINQQTVNELNCSIIAGAANNQLSDESIAQALLEQNILYAPDFIINAGGLIYLALQREGLLAESIQQRILKISDTLANVFNQSQETNQPTQNVAISLAKKIVYPR